MTKKYASDLPLPGGVEQYFATLVQLLRRVRENPCSHEELVTWVRETFPNASQATAINGYIGLVSRMGLWASKDDQIRLTPAGSDIVEKAESSESDARRAVIEIKLSEVEGYDALLRRMLKGEQSFDDLDCDLKAAIGADWKSKNQTMFRINWLRSLGYATKNGRTYVLTEQGQALARSLGEPEKKQPIPPVVDPDDGPTPVPAHQGELACRAAEISDRIEKAATMGGDGSELEQATAEAFTLFGYLTQVIGGSGNPDVLATAQMGDASYRVLVETKSRSGGVVHQNDVNFHALKEHKTKASADHAVVVGADFSGGNLEKWAAENGVRLMRTEELRQLLLAHAEAVLPLDSLRELFAGGGSLDEAVLSEVLTESENTALAMTLARQVYDAVRRHQDQEGVLNAHSLFYILGGQSPIPSIEMTIRLLQSDVIGAIGQSDKGSLYTRLAPAVLDAKLAQLARVMRADSPSSRTDTRQTR